MTSVLSFFAFKLTNTIDGKMEIDNQWSVPAILLFAKNADYKNEKCLKIRSFLYFTLKTEKRMPVFKFHSLL